MVCGVGSDMSAPCIKAIHRHLPYADIVHDKFHIAKHLNEAVDKTRRKAHRKLLKNKDERLKGTKHPRRMESRSRVGETSDAHLSGDRADRLCRNRVAEGGCPPSALTPPDVRITYHGGYR